MNRHPPLKTPHGPDETKWRVIVESDECVPGTLHSRQLQFEMLKNFAEQPMITALGYSMFQKMRMTHDGSKWVAEFEAILKNESKPQSA